MMGHVLSNFELLLMIQDPGMVKYLTGEADSMLQLVLQSP
jgi:hypothetical protein